jgi:hypothetical protein
MCACMCHLHSCRYCNFATNLLGVKATSASAFTAASHEHASAVDKLNVSTECVRALGENSWGALQACLEVRGMCVHRAYTFTHTVHIHSHM